jgi:23S rRNA (pseudouridine1915-N3)-methyltransferase
MRIDFICMGHRLPNWVNDGYQEYAKRLPTTWRLNLIEIPLRKRPKHANLAALQRQEGDEMLAAIATDTCVIALDEHGQQWDSIQLSQRLAQWQQEYSNLALLVGGPDGLAKECLQRAHQRWSLSTLTLPHQVVRIVVAEQLYRAWSLLQNHPYHRG